MHFVLDCVFYSTKVCKPPPEGVPSLGETLAYAFTNKLKKDAKPRKSKGRHAIGTLAPSTRAAINLLCSSDLYTTRPAEMTMAYCGDSATFYTAWHQGLEASHNVVDLDDGAEPAEEGGSKPVSFLSVASVEWDNKMLEWGRTDAPLCAAGCACAATTLVMNQGPLHAYRLPSDPHHHGYCLLCIRQDVEGLVMSVNARSKTTCGRVPVIMPPFKNAVGPGGYDPAACSVTPHNQSIFTGNVWIVRASGRLQVRLNPETGKCYVDQGELVYRGDSHEKQHSFLGGGAAATVGSMN